MDKLPLTMGSKKSSLKVNITVKDGIEELPKPKTGESQEKIEIKRDGSLLNFKDEQTQIFEKLDKLTRKMKQKDIEI